MRINGAWQKIESFRDARISRMAAERKKEIRMYHADDAGDNCSEAMSGGTLSLYVKKFRGESTPSDFIETSGPYGDK